MEVTRVVDAMERDGRRDQSRKVHGVRSAQRLGGSEGVNEEGYIAVHGVAKAVQYLEPWRTFDVPASAEVLPFSDLYVAVRGTMGRKTEHMQALHVHVQP